MDLAEWALEDPGRWGPWIAPCPISQEDLNRRKSVRRRKARMDARTRDRLPVLPVLVRAADQWRKDAQALLVAARETPPGREFTTAGQTLVKSVRPHADPDNVWANDPDTGKQRLLNREEDHAFWAWAVIEVLRLTGVRVEELLAHPGADIAGRIRATIRYLMDLDFQFGGEHTRKMLLVYWNAEIVPALRQRYPEVIRREIMSAAADAAELLGWSAYDAGRHGAAQRYFVQGLRLAREANDRLMGGQILSNLSHQANYLGNFSEAIQFARAAQACITEKASATVRAMFLAMEARALASIGDACGCVAVLHRAEQAFDQSSPSEDPEWIRYFDAWELAGEAAHCFRDLGRPRETRLFVAQAIDPIHTPPRTRVFIDMVSAAGALRAGDLDQAISIATDAVERAGALRSIRCVRYVADFHASITEKNASHPSVREFTESIKASYPALWTPGTS